MLEDLSSEANRLWLVFSHICRDEDQRVLHDLSQDWNVEPALSGMGPSLYVATRLRTVAEAVPAKPSTALADASQTKPVVDPTHDSPGEWNIRNACPPAH